MQPGTTGRVQLVHGAGALVATLLLTISVATSVRAQEERQTLTIYTAVCPVDYAATDFYTDCYGNPGTGFAFYIGPNGARAVSDADGLANLDIGDDAPGEVVIRHQTPGGADVWYEPTAVACTIGEETIDASIVSSRAATLLVIVQVPSNENVGCDLFFTPRRGAAEGSDESVEGGDGSEVTSLPNTGTGFSMSPGTRREWLLLPALLLPIWVASSWEFRKIAIHQSSV